MDRRSVSRRHLGKRDFNSGRPICRQFINGSCRFGQRCQYRHECPPVPSPEVCRYFQKGACWFGESCRYLHIQCPDGGTSGLRRGSAPVVHASALTAVSSERRGSEPSLVPQQRPYNLTRRGSEPLVANFALHQQSLQPLTSDIVEEEEYTLSEAEPVEQPEEKLRLQEGDDLALPSSSKTATTSAATVEVQERAVSEIDQQEGLEKGASASAEHGQSEAYNQSKDVFCGICMDKVYEKSTARERRFGILPNCTHAFCLSCIMTWRKTKEFQEDVIKACPQCRVKSSFYIPSKYWVYEDEPKAALIASFKEKSRKIKCNFFMRHGCCPFASECIFSHELPPGHRPHRRRFRPKSAMELLESMDSEDQRLLSYFIALTLLDDDDFEFLNEYELI